MTERALTRKQKRLAARRNVLTDEADNSIRIKNSLTVKDVKPLTDSQRKAVEQYYYGQNLFLTGLPGTGKTYLACALAIKDILTNNCDQDKLIIVRSAVPSKDLGFLPGNAKEKLKQYEAPYESIFSEIFGRGDAYSILKGKQIVDFMSTSFIRGLTIKNAIIIVDEFQNLSWNEIMAICSRVGHGSRIIFCGDTRQCDLMFDRDKRGHKLFINIVNNMPSISVVEFFVEDIVRSGFCKEWVVACSDYEKRVDQTLWT